jgi:RNA polymerase sigma-54 factor
MLSQSLNQTQKHEQRLSPQVIQYIKLLQKNSLELEQRIKQELEENPLLEEGLEQELALDSDSQQGEEEEGSDDRSRENDDWDYADLLPDDELYGHKAKVDQSPDTEGRELPTPYLESLSEHLMEQLSMLDLSEAEHLIAEQVVGSIDPDGYLRRRIESIVDDLSFSQGIDVAPADVERVLRTVQRLDPVGIAARDLQECLLVQLEVLPAETEGREEAIQILTTCYKDFTMKHFKQIMRRLDLTEQELLTAYELIQRLDPKPGEGDFSAGQNYIVPDFLVERVDDEFIITLNRRNAPQLRISRRYREMLRSVAAEKKNGRTSRVDKETRQFLKSKMESARWFISSIQQRQHTMLKVMHAIVDFQDAFFRYGEGNLRPMILKDVADRIEMDISTVSRVVNGKYVQTETGVFELKYFFSEGVSTDFGEDVSSREIKTLIERIIASESKRRPLSDQKLATLLKEQGFLIARRTVSKYREQLGIPVARLRRALT